MNNNQYNKMKGKKPTAGTAEAIAFALNEPVRKAKRKAKTKTKGAFGKKKR